jgi:hypothetical protein
MLPKSAQSNSHFRWYLRVFFRCFQAQLCQHFHGHHHGHFEIIFAVILRAFSCQNSFFKNDSMLSPQKNVFELSSLRLAVNYASTLSSYSGFCLKIFCLRSRLLCLFFYHGSSCVPVIKLFLSW